MNARNEIEDLILTEEIKAIKLGAFERYDDNNLEPFWANTPELIEQAMKMLDVEFDDGYGSENCRPVFVWTKTFLIVKACYDGSEWFVRLPRNPTNYFEPKSIGGG